MTVQANLWSDVSAIAQSVQEDAYFIVREASLMPQLVTTYTDMSGLNTRKSYKYNSGTAETVGEADDLTSRAFTPSADQTLTPAEIGLQFFISDSRAESEAPESIINDAARELGFAASDKVETDLLGDLGSLTGGTTIGASGTAITWGYVAAAIANARAANKNAAKPLACVIHGYQWAVLAKAASVAGASVVNAPQLQDQISRTGGNSVKVADFMGVPIYQVFGGISGTDFVGGVFPREAIAIDWRRAIRVRPQRDESRRGVELNMSAVYAHGVWRPELGVKMTFQAVAPTS
jgi:hypothetical protein